MRQLSIVMPALSGRMAACIIAQQIHSQAERFRGVVEFIALLDNGPLSTGSKMRTLYSLCSGRYICAVGDDDRVEPDYVASLVEAVQRGADLVTFEHSYSVDGTAFALTRQIPGCVERAFPSDTGGLEMHERLPGPLCPVRSEIVRGFVPPDSSDGEDAAYKNYLRGLDLSHHEVGRVLYHHCWVSHNKRERDALKTTWRRA